MSSDAGPGQRPVPTRIAVVIGSMGAGGAERVTATLADAWAAQGREVHVITLAARSTDFYGLDARIRRHALDLAADSGGLVSALLANGRRVRALRGLLREIDPDVTVGMTNIAAVLSLIASRRCRWPVVVEEHNHPPKMPPGRPWEVLRRRTYPWARSVVVLTRESLAWLQQDVPNARGMVIPNPLPFPVPTSEPNVPPGSVLADERLLLLAVGRLSYEKGFDVLITAFASLADAHPSWDLVIVGEGPDRAALEAQVASLGLTDRVRLPGVVGNVADWYARADLFVMSSRFEGFPMTLGEALAAGCPAVSFDCETGPRDLIQDGQNGRLVRPVEDPAALARTLSELMDDEPERRRMAAAATTVRDRYSLERILAMWDLAFQPPS